MKFELNVVKFNADVVATSGCEFEMCPGLEWDPGALEG